MDYYVSRWLARDGFTSGNTAEGYAKIFGEFLASDLGGPVERPTRQAMAAMLRRIGCKTSFTQPRRYFLHSFAVEDARKLHPELAPTVI